MFYICSRSCSQSRQNEKIHQFCILFVTHLQFCRNVVGRRGEGPTRGNTESCLKKTRIYDTFVYRQGSQQQKNLENVKNYLKGPCGMSDCFFCLLLVIFLKNHGLEDLYELFLYPYLANVIIFNPFLTGGSENDPATLVIMIMILVIAIMPPVG